MDYRSLALYLRTLRTCGIAYLRSGYLTRTIISTGIRLSAQMCLANRRSGLHVLIISRRVLLFNYHFRNRTFRMQVVLLINVVRRDYPCLIEVRLLSTRGFQVMVITRVRINDVRFSILICRWSTILTLRFSRMLSSSVMVRSRRVIIRPRLSTSRHETTSLFRKGLICLDFNRRIARKLFPLSVSNARVSFGHEFLSTKHEARRCASSFYLSIQVNNRMRSFEAQDALHCIMFPVAGSKDSVRAFSVVVAFLSIAMSSIMSNAFIIFLRCISMRSILSSRRFIKRTSGLMFAIFMRSSCVISIKAITCVFIFLRSNASRAFFAISVRFFINFNRLNDCSDVRITCFHTTQRIFAVLLFRTLVPISNVFHSIHRIVICLFRFHFRTYSRLVHLILIRLRSAHRLSFRRTRGIFLNRFTCRL